jgi:sigma-B regulation protein RsbU (phosphoserine phosphatase)
MPEVIDNIVREQLVIRRARLQEAVNGAQHPNHLHQLLDDVDAALAKMDDGSYGLCEECHTPIEGDRLLADPLLRFCLCRLTEGERDALEQDLELAARIQRGLLPPQNLFRQGWQVAYHYEAAGLVSGDYCDVIDAGDAGLYFMVGDVSGKGVAASMLTAHLHAMFRALISVGLPLKHMLEHASRLFCESVLPMQYATLVCGRALRDGRIEISNAGHPPPLVVRDRAVVPLDGANLPLGMFRKEEFSVGELYLEPGHGLVIYSDGVSEATDALGTEYGSERIQKVICSNCGPLGSELLAACREDLLRFCGNAKRADDITLFVLGRAAA